jgi:hypothetical protein
LYEVQWKSKKHGKYQTTWERYESLDCPKVWDEFLMLKIPPSAKPKTPKSREPTPSPRLAGNRNEENTLFVALKNKYELENNVSNVTQAVYMRLWDQACEKIASENSGTRRKK